MMRLLLAAALLLSPALAAAQTKPKPAAAKPKPKPAPAKPAPKPDPAPDADATPGPAAEKPKPAPRRARATPDRADKNGFGVVQVAAPDSDKFMAGWKLGAASQATSTTSIANKPLFTFLIFHGCKPNGVGLCDVVADFVIHRPDGSTNEDNKEVVVWNKAAPVDPKRAYLGEGAIGYGVDDEGPFGNYRVVATVTDRVAGVSVTTEQTLTFAPAIK